MGATALVFPGQGSQRAGMRAAVERACPHLITLAHEYAGTDVFDNLDGGTRFLQPAIYSTSIANWIEAGAPRGTYVAGHSLGEFAALVVAGAMSVEEGLRLVAFRGQVMHDAAEAAPGGMLAVGCGLEEAEELAERHGVSVANDNANDQVVLSGPHEALDRVKREARSRRHAAVVLPVEGALHSPAMAPAVPALERLVTAIDFLPPRVPVFSGVTAQPFDDLPRRLCEGVTARVRWREIVLELARRGVDRFIEVGPGDVLTKLIRRTLSDVHVEAIGDSYAATA